MRLGRLNYTLNGKQAAQTQVQVAVATAAQIICKRVKCITGWAAAWAPSTAAAASTAPHTLTHTQSSNTQTHVTN